MKDKLLLLKSTNNKSIHDRIWWTYNYGSGQKNQISDEIAKKFSESLDSFIDDKIHFLLSEDNEGIYDYGGLNDFFIDIVENFQFYKREKYRNECVGKDINIMENLIEAYASV